ncbi:hypothetical protein D3C72_1525080 [compost metagenome]
MVCTTSATALPPCSDTFDASRARRFACCALSAFWRTVEISSSIDEATSSSEPACCSVRCDKSRLPVAISVEAVAMLSVPWRTLPTMAARLSRMVLMANSRLLSSPWRVCTSMANSPSAMRPAIAAAYAGSPPSWRSRPRVMTVATAMQMSTLSAASTPIQRSDWP